LHPRIVDMVDYAKRSGIKEVFTLTNGLLLNEKLMHELFNAGLDWLQLSIDGAFDVYEQIRYPAKFEDILGKVKMLHKIRSRKKCLRPIIWVQSLWSAVKHNPQEFIELFSSYTDKIAFHVDFDYENRFKKDPSFVCYRLWHRLLIMADGTVPMCNSDFLKDEIIGDVNVETIREIWNGEKLKRVRELNVKKDRLKLKPCRSCNWGNLRDKKEISVGDKKLSVLCNIAVEQHKQELRAVEI
jgi:radical SAM protein with 4Fe4S-binding SPASM domain